MTTRFYHTRDPIENLRVRVTVRKIAHGDRPAGRATPLGVTWSACFQWQDRSHAAKNRRSRKAAVDIDAHEDREHASHHHGAMICSYADADNYVPRSVYRRGLSTSDAPPSHVAADLQLNQSHTRRADAVNRSAAAWTSNRKRVALRLHREETSRQMHLVFRLDGDASHDGGEDLLLASLRYYPHSGLLCVTPAFSECIGSEAMDNTKGPILGTYQKTNRVTGEVFEYALDNENDLFPAVSGDDLRLLKELRQQEAKDDYNETNGWHNQHGDSRLVSEKQTSAPGTNDRAERIHAQLEIVSAHNLRTWDPVRVVVEMDRTACRERSPNHLAWEVEEWSQLHTRWSRQVKTDTGSPRVAFAHHFNMCFTRQRNDSAGLDTTTANSLAVLRLFLFSRDSWKRERQIGQGEIRVQLGTELLETVVLLWQQVIPVHDQVDELLLGKSTTGMGCKETSFELSATSRENVVHTRFGTQTVSTGATIRIRLQFLRYCPDTLRPKSLLPVVSAPTSSTSSNGAMKRSVKEILDSLEASRTSLHTSAHGITTLSAAHGDSARSIQEILSRVRQRDNSRSEA